MTAIQDVKADGLLHHGSRADRFWSTTNIAEAMPGVATPLGWSVWGPGTELGVRDTFRRMGALVGKDVRVPDDESERFISLFYGRAVLSVTFLCAMGDRLPGTDGATMAEQLIGEVPPALELNPTKSRLPFVAGWLPWSMARIRRDVLAGTPAVRTWRLDLLRRMDGLDLRGATAALGEGRDQFNAMMALQARAVFVGVQTALEQQVAVIAKAGLEPAAANALMAGQGDHAEALLVRDLWDLSRERLSMEAFIERYGFHGPYEGEVSSTVWREDTGPIERLVAEYAARPDDEDPRRSAARRVEERLAAERDLLRGLPAKDRPGARLVLKMAVSRIPLRGVAKGAFLQSLDVVRASARRIGTLQADAGVLDDPEDAFYFTVDEHLAGLGPDAKEVAAERRTTRELLQEHNIPTHSQGVPVPYTSGAGPAAGDSDGDGEVEGVAASGGVVEGIVNVVDDPAFIDIEPDAVLVCRTTDPSWSSILFLSSALVVDIGGLLSHAAVVARELGIPCVAGTQNGTRTLRTGDRVRVDGNTGRVDVLERSLRRHAHHPGAHRDH